MANYKEIVTKAVISKGKKLFTTNHSIAVTNPSTILGCWVINHNFKGYPNSGKIVIDGSFDVNIWYSFDGDTKTNVINKKINYIIDFYFNKKDKYSLFIYSLLSSI